jgi:NitT/TauT family transport system substrate-binding protein
MTNAKLRVFPAVSRNRNPVKYVEELMHVARFSERSGFEGILLFAGNDVFVEPWSMAQHIVANTKRSSPLIAVTPNNGSDFTTLKMIEGFLEPQHVKRINAGSMLKRLEAVRDGKVAAASLMEPWISVAQKWGMRILIESHSTRAEAAGDDLDGETLKKMFRAQARAVEKIEKDPRPYIHYFIRETGGLLKPEEFQTWRLLHGAPTPYTRERWDDTYRWTVKWNMTVPGATYENTVDNRAWE